MTIQVVKPVVVQLDSMVSSKFLQTWSKPFMQSDQPNDPVNPYAVPEAKASPTDDVWTQGSMADYREAEFRPFKTIWFDPRSTIQQIVSRDPTLYVIPLACVYGFTNALSHARTRALELNAIAPITFVILVLLSPLLGLISIWIFSALVRGTGTWLGGEATDEEVRAATIWGSLPMIATLPFRLIHLAIAGVFMASNDPADLVAVLSPVVSSINWVSLALSLWAIPMLCKTIAEVQGFRSAWMGFANGALALVAAFVLWVVLALATMYLLTLLP